MAINLESVALRRISGYFSTGVFGFQPFLCMDEKMLLPHGILIG